MGIFNSLLSEYQLHKKSRTTRHSSYPERFAVPDNMISWCTAFPEYAPAVYNAPIVLDMNTSWADPQDIMKISRKLTSFEGKIAFSVDGFPLNPFGRTGLAGRGVLGKWGANFAVDGLITTIHPENNCLMILTIVREDTGETAIPGGMADPGENVYATRNRELAEELSFTSADLSKAICERVISRGYADDPRNTDNAWIETIVIHSHMPYEAIATMILKAGDDAKGFNWVDITPDHVRSFYGSHGLTLLKAIKELLHSRSAHLGRSMHDYLLDMCGEF